MTIAARAWVIVCGCGCHNTRSMFSQWWDGASWTYGREHAQEYTLQDARVTRVTAAAHVTAHGKQWPAKVYRRGRSTR